MLILKIQSDTKRTDNSLPKPRTILNNIFIIQYGRNEKIRFFFHKTTIRINERQSESFRFCRIEL